ncbi:MAG: hypothetical protein QXR60_00020 [Candidatus Nanoarchaeia archaeon]
MDIKKELDEYKTVLLVIPGQEYSTVVLDTMKSLSGNTVGYVTLNKTFGSLKDLFAKNNISLDNVVFIDGISKMVMDVPSQTDGCYFVSSPSSLTELSILIGRLLNHNFKYIIFDSLTNLYIYKDKDAVTKFISLIINKIESHEANSIFFAVKYSDQEKVIEEISMFFNKVIDLKTEH